MYRGMAIAFVALAAFDYFYLGGRYNSLSPNNVAFHIAFLLTFHAPAVVPLGGVETWFNNSQANRQALRRLWAAQHRAQATSPGSLYARVGRTGTKACRGQHHINKANDSLLDRAALCWIPNAPRALLTAN